MVADAPKSMVSRTGNQCRDPKGKQMRFKENERDWAAEKKAREDCGRLWKIVDARVAERRFLCADHVTLADITLGCWVHRWFMLPIERPDLPNLAAYYEALKTRPGFVTHVALPLE